MVLLVLILTASMVVAVPGAARQAAEAAEGPAAPLPPPPGGLVPSTPDVGRTEGQFSVSDDGAAQYKLPFWLPAGRGDGRYLPKLSLAYNSRSGNGPVGVGWSLTGLSAVTRCAKTIAQDGFTDGVHFTASDAFCLDGNRLVLVNDEGPDWEFRTELESFARITAIGMDDGIPNSFRVEAKDGTKHTLGGTDDSRLEAFQLAPGTAPNTLVRESTTRVTVAWSLSRSEDRNGNAATIEYQEFEGGEDSQWHVESRLQKITYEPNREVRFSYETRQDPVEDYAVGVHSRQPFRLSNVQMFGGSVGGTRELLREYRLAYDTNSVTLRSLLSTIQECVSDPSTQPGESPQLKCKRKLMLDWSMGGNGYQFDTIDTTVTDAGQQGPHPLPDRDSRIMPLDINGDGLMDILYPKTEQVTPIGERQQWRIRKSHRTGFDDIAFVAGFQTQMSQCPQTNPPPNAGACTTPDAHIRLIDHNLDGMTDALVWVGTNDANPEAKQWQLFTSTGNSFVRDPSGLSTPLETDRKPDPVAWADLDGNGTPDLITAPAREDDQVEGISEPWRYALNNGSGGPNAFGPWVDTRRMVPQFQAGIIKDVNADNRMDFVAHDGGWGLGGSGNVVQDRELEAFSAGTLYDDDKGDVNGDGLADAINSMEFDCDANPDRLTSLRASLSSGKGFAPYSETPAYWEPLLSCIPRDDEEPDPNPVFVPNPAFDRGVRIVDFNGDGHDDVLVFRPRVPTGPHDDFNGAQLYIWRDGQFERAPLSTSVGNRTSAGFVANQVLDFNGDSLQDILHVEGDHLRLLLRRDGHVDQLIGIGNLAEGNRVEVEYTTLADRAVHTPGAATYPQVAVKTGGSIVKRHKVATNAAPNLTWDTYDHTYVGARMDVQGRGWLGFAQHAVSQLQTGARVETNFDNITRDPGGPGMPSVYPFAMRPAGVNYLVVDNPVDPFGRVSREYLKNAVTTYTFERRGGGYTVQPRLTTVSESERLLGAPVFDVVRMGSTHTEFDEFGNAVVVRSFTGGGRSQRVETLFRNDQVNWLIGLAERTVTTGCLAGNTVCTSIPPVECPEPTPEVPDPGCRKRVSTALYDDRGQVDVSVVEPEQTDPNVRADVTLTTDTDYDGFGNVTSVTTKDSPRAGTAATSRIKRFEYNNEDKLFATDTIEVNDNPAVPELRTKVTTEPGLGVVRDTTDPNGVLTTMKHDRFGRLRETHRSDGSSEVITHSFAAGSAEESTQTAVAGGGLSTVVADRFGREIERRTKTFGGATAISRTTYDQLGRVSSVTRPVFEDQPPGRATVTTYDRRNRVATVTAPDNVVVTHVYVNRETRTIDGNGVHSSTVVASVDGDVELSSEPDGNPNSANRLQTRFTYDHFGQPAKVIAPDGTEQVMEYDILGRRTKLTDLSTGLTTTQYTAFGQVRSKTDATGVATTFKYDVLGRLLKKETSTGEVTTHSYDTGPNGKGKPVSSRSPDGVGKDYRYNNRGQLTSTTWSMGGATFPMDHEYDNVGRQATLTYPAVQGTTDRLKIANVYNQHGYLAQIKDAVTGLDPCTNEDHAAGLCFWTALQYEADGQLKQDLLGNGVFTEHTYKPLTGLLDKIKSTGPGTVGIVGELFYDYENNRNVKERNNLVDQRRETFHYDTLNRLDQWKVFNASNQEIVSDGYSYDPRASDPTNTTPTMGNLTKESRGRPGRPIETITYKYGGAGEPPHALTDRNGTRYTYDQAGRQDTGDGRTITYNANDLPKSMTWAQNQRTEFDYDPDGARVRKADNQQTVITIPGRWEMQNPSGTGSTQVHTTHYIPTPGRTTVQLTRVQNQPNGPITGTRIWYLHEDLQGSTYLITRPGGREPDEPDDSWLNNLFYSPWGERLDTANNPLDPARRGKAMTGYTGHEHNDEFGLINMKGRMYDPKQRRFTTPDPIIQSPLSSQNHNRYTYVRNNPATNTDPTGHLEFNPSNLDFQKSSWGLWRHGGNLLALTADLNGTSTDPLQEWVSTIGGGLIGAALRMGELSTESPSIEQTRVSFQSSGSIGNNNAHAAELIELANRPDTSPEDRELLEIAAETLRTQGDADSSGNEVIVVQEPNFYIPTAGDILGIWGASAAIGVIAGAATLAAPVAAGVGAGIRGAGAAAVGVGVAAFKKIRKALSRDPKSFKNQAPEHGPRAVREIDPKALQKRGVHGEFSYVVNMHGELVIGPTNVGGIHVDLALGEPVLAAGTVTIQYGRIVKITNDSGHYLPSGKHAAGAAEKAFNAEGFDATGKYVEEFGR